MISYKPNTNSIRTIDTIGSPGWQASATIFPPSGGLLGRFVGGFVPWYTYVGWYPLDGHRPACILEPLDLSRDVLNGVGS
jgi:hypothetical protein